MAQRRKRKVQNWKRKNAKQRGANTRELLGVHKPCDVNQFYDEAFQAPDGCNSRLARRVIKINDNPTTTVREK